MTLFFCQVFRAIQNCTGVDKTIKSPLTFKLLDGGDFIYLPKNNSFSPKREECFVFYDRHGNIHRDNAPAIITNSYSRQYCRGLVVSEEKL